MEAWRCIDSPLEGSYPKMACYLAHMCQVVGVLRETSRLKVPCATHVVVFIKSALLKEVIPHFMEVVGSFFDEVASG